MMGPAERFIHQIHPMFPEPQLHARHMLGS